MGAFMNLDNIIILVFVVAALGALIGIGLNARHKEKQEKKQPVARE